MEELIKQLAEYVALSIEALGILIIAVGTLEALAAVVRALIGFSWSVLARREAWMKYMHWLAAGLTFQLAGGHRSLCGRADLGRRRPAGGDCGNPDVPDLFPRSRHGEPAQAAGGGKRC
jgi:hypothetical protein